MSSYEDLFPRGDPEVAAREGPVAIDEPRVGREVVPFGPGEAVGG